LGEYGRTDNNGQVTLELPDGDYKFRAYTNGQYYWSAAVNSPAQDSTTIDIRQYNIEVTVVDDAGKGVKESNLYVYGYTENGSYTGLYGQTNGNGRVKLEAPAGTYQFRVYYSGSYYWSETVTVPDTDEIFIKTEERPFTVSVVDNSGQPVKNIWVYAFTANSTYWGLNGKTNNQGEVIFDLPRGSYQFRADYKNQSFWSSIINTTAGSSTPITLK
jgi:protocatechuate 3,4-dioxygenase beta subunit